MRAMILAAGRGERLRPLTDQTPKPLLPIAGQPLIAHQLQWLERAGIRDIVINLHHLGESIATALGDGRAFGVHITYSREETRLETGGGIAQALPLLGNAPFAIVNGDIWTDYPFARLFDAAASLGSDLAHLVLTRTPANRVEGDFGLTADRVTRDDGRPYTYCGISVLAPALFDDVPAAPFSLRELLFTAIADQRVRGELWRGHWRDIGTPEELENLRRIAR
jgi:N-acetyl-alpha-D-muramate 1-phosphate uridylyltransferase